MSKVLDLSIKNFHSCSFRQLYVIIFYNELYVIYLYYYDKIVKICNKIIIQDSDFSIKKSLAQQNVKVRIDQLSWYELTNGPNRPQAEVLIDQSQNVRIDQVPNRPRPELTTENVRIEQGPNRPRSELSNILSLCVSIFL